MSEQDLLAQALSERTGRKVDVACPKRGEKKELVDHALTNAREALGRRLAETSSQARLLKGVAEAFDLPQPPRRIEVYDNSHIMGTNAVGGMIVAGLEASPRVSTASSTSSRKISAADLRKPPARPVC